MLRKLISTKKQTDGYRQTLTNKNAQMVNTWKKKCINQKNLWIVEITYTIYQGLSKRQLCKEYIRRKINNLQGVYLPSLLPREITCLDPTNQSKKPVTGQLSTSKNHAISMSSKPKPVIWSCNTGQQIACSDSCQLTIMWMPIINDVAMVVALLS